MEPDLGFRYVKMCWKSDPSGFFEMTMVELLFACIN
jgi:hypothetical protein